ncbi:mediator of RNA polymerase II transcription subunit 26-like, partial [Tropilaelaps mercedesae]
MTKSMMHRGGRATTISEKVGLCMRFSVQHGPDLRSRLPFICRSVRRISEGRRCFDGTQQKLSFAPSHLSHLAMCQDGRGWLRADLSLGEAATITAMTYRDSTQQTTILTVHRTEDFSKLKAGQAYKASVSDAGAEFWLRLFRFPCSFEVGFAHESHGTRFNSLREVVDMVAVLDCISLLESLPIRREDLERTRLGRVVNELRKKTSDVALQRRAKDLVRGWRKLLDENPPSVGLGSTPNGTAQHPHAPHTPLTHHAAQKVSSPALSASAAATPATPLGASHGAHGGVQTRVAQLQMQSGVAGAGGHGRITSPASSVSNSPVLRTRNGSGFKPVSPAVPTGSPSPNAVAPLASHAASGGSGQTA